eukprot:3701226-Rhodomonas_salina.2
MATSSPLAGVPSRWLPVVLTRRPAEGAGPALAGDHSRIACRSRPVPVKSEGRGPAGGRQGRCPGPWPDPAGVAQAHWHCRLPVRVTVPVCSSVTRTQTQQLPD